jgi:hypothetical protein
MGTDTIKKLVRKELNPFVLNLIQKYALGGGYYWPKDSSSDGTTQDISYQGEIVARKHSSGETYCCGLTFEVYLLSYKSVCDSIHIPFKIDNLTPKDVRQMKSDWFVATGKLKGPADALVPRKLGYEIQMEDAKPGDFLQLWRDVPPPSLSGHSVVFLNWIRAKDRMTGGDNTIIGLNYWTTQTSTNGIGKRVEFFGEPSKRLGYNAGSKPVKNVYIARALTPEILEVENPQPLSTMSASDVISTT